MQSINDVNIENLLKFLTERSGPWGIIRDYELECGVKEFLGFESDFYNYELMRRQADLEEAVRHVLLDSKLIVQIEGNTRMAYKIRIWKDHK